MSGFDVKGIRAAAATWITGALGLAIATSYWGLGVVVGVVTVVVLFIADSFPDEESVRQNSNRKIPNGEIAEGTAAPIAASSDILRCNIILCIAKS